MQRSDRVTARGFGPDYPVATNGTRAGRQQNPGSSSWSRATLIGTPIGATGR